MVVKVRKLKTMMVMGSSGDYDDGGSDSGDDDGGSDGYDDNGDELSNVRSSIILQSGEPECNLLH